MKNFRSIKSQIFTEHVIKFSNKYHLLENQLKLPNYCAALQLVSVEKLDDNSFVVVCIFPFAIGVLLSEKVTSALTCISKLFFFHCFSTNLIIITVESISNSQKTI